MENKEIKEKLEELSKKYPNVNSVDFNYYGSGDSFDSYDVDVLPAGEEVENSDFEDLFWVMVEKADSNFNNDGSRGTVSFDLKGKTVEINDYYIYTEEGLNANIKI